MLYLKVESFLDWIWPMKLGESLIINAVMLSCCSLDCLHPHMHVVLRYVSLYSADIES